MNHPAVSVILPAYNCEKYIGKAIQSVLGQTFTNFELIIVNDGSTDKTEFAVLAFADPRIAYIKNPVNQGLISSLNRAIGLAQGKYIARMDADDICYANRLANQKDFLDQNDDITVVASTIEFIDDNDKETGIWELDRKTITTAQIRKTMLYENCIAHPTIMMRTDILKDLKYKEYQKNIEDYDLWLRLLNRGHKIAKLNEPLLFYRLHDASVTSIHLKTANPFFKHLRMKQKFLVREILALHISGFLFRVCISAFFDLINGAGKSIKNLFR